MDYTIAAIPTLYNGRQYRSRLEARWAAFFDLLGWKHEYEPFDLGKWSPDFILIGENISVLVEVKPITWFNAAVAAKMVSACPKQSDTHLLLVGTTPFLPTVTPDGSRDSSGTEIGWCCTRWSDELTATPDGSRDPPIWSSATIGFSGHPSRFDLFPEFPWGWLRGEKQGPDQRPPFGWFSHVVKVKDLWMAATNLVQWHPS